MRHIEYMIDWINNCENDNIAILGIEDFPYENYKINKSDFLEYSLNFFKDKNVVVINTDDIIDFFTCVEKDYSNYTLYLSRVFEHFRNFGSILKLLINKFKNIHVIVPDNYSNYKILKHKLKNDTVLDYKTIFLNYELYGGCSDLNSYHGLFTSKLIMKKFNEFFDTTAIKDIVIDNSPHLEFTINGENSKSNDFYSQWNFTIHDDVRPCVYINDENNKQEKFFDKCLDVDMLLSIINDYNDTTIDIYNFLASQDIESLPFILWSISKQCTIHTRLNFHENDAGYIIKKYHQIFQNKFIISDYMHFCMEIYNHIFSNDNVDDLNIFKTFINADMIKILLAQEDLFLFNQKTTYSKERICFDTRIRII